MGSFIAGLFLTVLGLCFVSLAVVGTWYIIKRAIVEVNLLKSVKTARELKELKRGY
jgi:uncharacterized membrane protein